MASRTFPHRTFLLPPTIPAFLSRPTPAGSMFINAFYLYVFLTKLIDLTAMLFYVLNHLLSHAKLSRCKDSSITSCCNQGCPSYTPHGSHGSTNAILFYQSSRRHLPTLLHVLILLRPCSSTTYLDGGTLPPRHLVFHFPTTSDLPQELPLL